MREWILLAFLLVALGLVGCREESGTAGQVAARPEAEEGEGHAEIITLTPEGVRNARFQTSEARRKSLAVGLTVPARLVFPRGGVAQVAARVPGRLAGVAVDLGERVKKGQVLGQLESSELGQARADYLSAVMKAQVAAEDFRREKELLAKSITSEREMRRAESAFTSAQTERNAAESRLHIMGLTDPEIRALKADEHYGSHFPARSPLDGTVVEIFGTVGQAVADTTPLFTVGDLSTLWALLDVAETQLATVQSGQPVVLTVQAYPGRRFQGQVRYVGDLVDEKTRTTQVRVVLPNEDGVLKPGMFATAEILTGANADAGVEAQRLVVPREAVQKVGERQIVFVPRGENRFEAVEVDTGSSSATEVEILSGLEPGVRVVTQGAFVLKSELSKESMGEGHSH